MTPETTPCVICSGPRAARDLPPRLVRGYACNGCVDRMRRQLLDLPRFYVLALAMLQPGQGSGKSNERSIGVRIAALNIRNAYPWIDRLRGWERLVREERELSPVPTWTNHATDPTGAALARVCGFLRTHLDWLAEFAAVDEFAAELAELWREGRGMDGGHRANRYTAACPTDGCGRDIRLGVDDLAGDVTCGHCGVQRPAAWLLRASEDTYVDAEAVAVQFGVQEADVKRWGRRGAVRRRNGLFSIADVARKVAGE